MKLEILFGAYAAKNKYATKNINFGLLLTTTTCHSDIFVINDVFWSEIKPEFPHLVTK